MDEMKIMYEVFEVLPRCGPGTNEATRHAFMECVGLAAGPRVLDIGCGTGMQTIELARISGGNVVALDNHKPFLLQVKDKALKAGVAGQVEIKHQSMTEMEFDERSFDLIWSEGALYSMGFENGLNVCRRLLKEEGYIVVSEAVYLTEDRPEEVTEFWEREYPDIGTVGEKIEVIRQTVLKLKGHFTLKKSGWLEGYYLPMEEALKTLREKYSNEAEAQGVFDAFGKEIEFYKSFSDYYGYEFFIMQK